jgi:hypothetical protein
MSKLIKIILLALFLASASGSALYYFDLLPFVKKTKGKVLQTTPDFSSLIPKETSRAKEIKEESSPSCFISPDTNPTTHE